jgi:hypothetical protein
MPGRKRSAKETTIAVKKVLRVERAVRAMAEQRKIEIKESAKMAPQTGMAEIVNLKQILATPGQ